MAQPYQVEKWGLFELALPGPGEGNPFTDVELSARFECEESSFTVKGFYDGNGMFRIRAMPDREGKWAYRTASNRAELDGKVGTFDCTAATPGNHGPVQTEGLHFTWADGTPCFVMGTTAYAWTYRPESVRNETLSGLETFGFNKVRMLFFPKFYAFDRYIDTNYEPPVYPFEGEPGSFDFERFDPRYFQNFEQRVHDLLVRNVQADVILFHPYDDGRWGIPHGMSHEQEMRYVDFMVARLSAYRNVWWSLANEFDLLRPAFGFRSREWDTIGLRIMETDPYHHPRSVHNWPWAPPFPDAEWLTHVSYQHPNTYSLLIDLRRRYNKPVIDDEYQYEGTVPFEPANCTPQLEMRRHWLAALAGGYATHGEIIPQSDNTQDYFWAYGGPLKGESPRRLKFLRDLMESLPFHQLVPDPIRTNGDTLFASHKGEEVYLFFVTPEHKDRGYLWIGPGYWHSCRYQIGVYDAWACRMTFEDTVDGGQVNLQLPEWAVVTATRVL